MTPEIGNVGPLKLVPERDLYPVNDAAFRLGITPRKLWTLIAEGRIRSVKLDSRRLVPADALTEFIEGLPTGDKAAVA
ncbi:MAG TPA: helix-turn-helix domain-containing protein [Micromonospora sp.]|nr:helix-turn-helix domain-containing protein [Micromonospora sp.]